MLFVIRCIRPWKHIFRKAIQPATRHAIPQLLNVSRRHALGNLYGEATGNKLRLNEWLSQEKDW